MHRNYQHLRLPDKVVNNHGRMGKPWGIALGKYGVWAVTQTADHCVCIFDAQNQLVKKFGGKGSEKSQFQFPRGIAFDNDNHLYVVDTDNHRVQKFSVNGNYLLQFGTGDGQLKTPHGVTTHNSRVYIADTDNHCISVFQYNGQFCISFGSDQLSDPWDVAVNVNNQLVVAEHKKHCIVTFTLDGQYINKFGTDGSNRGNPHSLATGVKGRIFVTDDNHHVSIFDQAGNIIHCFGSHGSENGQFYFPVGIALSHNGSVYVSDHQNKRIQIFTKY